MLALIMVCVFLSYFLHPNLPIFFGVVAVGSIVVKVIDERKQAKLLEDDTDDFDDETELDEVDEEKQRKEEVKRMKAEIKLSDANNTIEYLTPKRKEILAKLKKLQADFDGIDQKKEKEIERLKDKEYTISKQLSKAERDKMDAEMFLYGKVWVR